MIVDRAAVSAGRWPVRRRGVSTDSAPLIAQHDRAANGAPTKVRDVFRPHCAPTCPCSPAFAVNPERGLLEEAGRAVLTWDAAWDQWTPQRQVNQWLARLRGDQAAAAARALREHHDAARHFAELADDHRVDERIRRAVRPAPSAPPGERRPARPPRLRQGTGAPVLPRSPPPGPYCTNGRS